MNVALVGLVLTVLGVLWAIGLFVFGYGDVPVILSLFVASIGLVVMVAPEKDTLYR